MKHHKLALAARGIGLLGALGLAIVVVLAGVAVVYGPAVMEALRFLDDIEQQGTEIAALSEGEYLYQGCIYCHGQGGNAESSFYPRLAGQPQNYLRQALMDYRESRRDNAMMESLARNLSDDDLDTLVVYLSKQQANSENHGLVDVELVKHGKRLASQLACLTCHSSDYTLKDDNPRLAGQGREYIETQLRAFRDGDRRDTGGVMAGFATSLADSDIKKLAAYFSSL